MSFVFAGSKEKVRIGEKLIRCVSEFSKLYTNVALEVSSRQLHMFSSGTESRPDPADTHFGDFIVNMDLVLSNFLKY